MELGESLIAAYMTLWSAAIGALVWGTYRRLEHRIDGVEERLTLRIDGVEDRLTLRIDGVEERLTLRIDGVEDRLGLRIDRLEERGDHNFASVRADITQIALAVGASKRASEG